MANLIDTAANKPVMLYNKPRQRNVSAGGLFNLNFCTETAPPYLSYIVYNISCLYFCSVAELLLNC